MKSKKKRAAKKPNPEANTAFVRIHPKVRDRLVRHCKRAGGIVAARLLSDLATAYLDRQEKKSTRKPRAKAAAAAE